MTSTPMVVTTPESRVEADPLRVLHIAANLLPDEIIAARREHKLRWMIGAVLLVVIAGLVGWDIHARQETSAAKDDLQVVQQRVDNLRAQQNQYATLNATKNGSNQIAAQLRTLMVGDVPWWKLYPTLDALATRYGINVVNMDGGTITQSSTGSVGTAPIPGVTSATAVGQISITGTAPNQAGLAAYVEQMNKTKGLLNAFLSSAASQSSSVQFTLQVQFTAYYYQGRYSTTNATTGGK